MAHDHSQHHHAEVPENLNHAFIFGITLNFVFVIIEAVAGFYNNSLSLLSDAGHNLADVGALALSLFAFKMLKVKSSSKYTYGLRKTSILVPLLNSVVLLISIGIIVFEAVQRLFHPSEVPGITVSITAGIGIAINFASAMLFFKNKESDINVKAAYLHLMSDAVVSLGIVIGGILIYYLKWYWLDAVISIIVAFIILISTWKLLKDSLRLSLDGVPENIDIEEIKIAALSISGVKDLHHIHIWAISTKENALTAHLVVAPQTTIPDEEKIKHELKHLFQHKNIHHITLETERQSCEIIEC